MTPEREAQMRGEFEKEMRRYLAKLRGPHCMALSTKLSGQYAYLETEIAWRSWRAALRAQADARPVWQIQGAPDSWLDVDEETWKWSDESRRRIVYTHPEASAPGLSREDSDLLRELLYRVEYDPGSPTEEKLHQAYEIITRGRAATLRLPPTTGLPQAAYCASAATVAEPDTDNVWPIVNITVSESGEVTAAKLYAPGLPAGNHDVYPVRVPYMDEHTEAWMAVAKALKEVAPSYLDGPGNGIECAVKAIHRLATQQQTEPSEREINEIWTTQADREAAQRARMQERFANRPTTPATADFDLPAPNDAMGQQAERQAKMEAIYTSEYCEEIERRIQQAEPESVIKRQAQKIAELIADRDSWIEAHARLYRLYHDQSPRAGEEIHVNVEGGDVYTLPLQLSGMDKPRFVVHVPCPPQAEPGADERAAWDAFLAAKSYPGQWREQNAFYAGYRAGQRAGVAEDANLLRDAAEKGLDINQQPQLGCVEVWAGKGDDALVFREYYSGHADREAATKCALKRALAAPTQQQEGE